jgi:hypothetical protein
MVDVDEVMRENWVGKCTECGWSHSDIGSMGVSAEARIHLNKESGHSVEVYRDDDLMEVIDSVTQSGSYDEYLGQDAAPLREREEEQERIASEVADLPSEDADDDSDTMDE